MENKNYIMVGVKESTHNRLMILKIKCKAKNLNEVIKLLIQTYNKAQLNAREDK